MLQPKNSRMGCPNSIPKYPGNFLKMRIPQQITSSIVFFGFSKNLSFWDKDRDPGDNLTSQEGNSLFQNQAIPE